jgi:aminopeptidase N
LCILNIDLVAVPDFAAGAMENWGLMTFRENYLLSNQASASAADKQDVALVVAHELAHQVKQVWNLISNTFHR